jgi:hypothetical protein
MDSLAETRSKIEQDVSKIIECLGDSDWGTRKAALEVIGKLVEYRK